MVETEFSISHKYPIELTLQASIHIPRQDIPNFCKAFDSIVQDNNGGYFYYPEYDKTKTKCRYEWFIKHNREPYGIRISTFFDAENQQDINNLSFFVSWGPKFIGNVGKGLNKTLELKVKNTILKVFNEIDKISIEKPQTKWHYISYLHLPSAKTISTTIQNDLITIYPTRRHKKTEKYLTAISLNTSNFYQNQAIQNSIPTLEKFAMLMSLLLNDTVKIENIKWPKNVRFKNIVKKLPSIESIYLETQFDSKIITQDILSISQIAANLLTNTEFMNSKKLWESMNAYTAGLEIAHSQPTLSSVAFVASLSAFCRKQSCGGQIKCSHCGDLSFKHDLISERQALVTMIKEELLVNPTEEQIKYLNQLFSSIYAKQRSSFVHDATLRHSELDEIKPILGHPGKNTPTNKIYEYKEHLQSLRFIARNLLLKKLMFYNEEVKTLFPSQNSIRIKNSLIMGIAIKGNRWTGISFN